MVRRILGGVLIVLAVSAVAEAAARDAIDLSKVTVYNSPKDVASWPVTTAITDLHMRPEGVFPAGVSLTFSAQQTWPDYTPPGWDGPLQYTVWPVVKVNGQYYTSGIVQMWRGRASTGAPLPSEWYNWAYDSRWGPMNYNAGYQPQVGELVGFFVTAGNARGVTTVTSVRERSNVVTISMPAGDNGDWKFSSSFTTIAGDADGDGKADIATFRPSTGAWHGLASSTSFSSGASATWGVPGDVPLTGDFDGDGKADVTVYRPSTGGWWILLSGTSYSTYSSYTWGGSSGDVPVPADYDGDGKTDIAIFRPSNGTWWILWSRSDYKSYSTYQWGATGDTPVPADYDGDGKADITIYRPSNGSWWVLGSRSNFTSYNLYHWGVAGDIAVPADYDGDGKADFAIYRPATGQWWILTSGTAFAGYFTFSWGSTGDVPAPGDFDGDGRTDLAIFRPSTGDWWILWSSTNGSSYSTYNLGASGDVPLLGRQ